ncbi:HU family DNA-binding protein [Arthrobacter bambusae]|uniref:Nucleoid DNA-binding protein n=1 Tax=Arthrobacter bambusae TaxID=1338426 RepID=A0AAW8D4Z0_9MICC|nr:HU family DNA-binding protein [Arthrobacter bambusae]MDP9903187.1 nucleoid DNA-binding protein [Arthrobacter bambusae]MDQ0128819.1 nucleoid DNA-binding protein [Arthrobacter bambusae]MDQ0180160.1 nucleoid DNA-binding protein [Arthrobacter bambusae]
MSDEQAMSDEGLQDDAAEGQTGENEPRRISKRDFIREVALDAHLPYNVTERFYESFISTLLNHVRAGEQVNLTGFGRFYWQLHGGHTVKFSPKGKVDPYPVMRFSAARDLGGFLKLSDEEVKSTRVPGTRLMKPGTGKNKDASAEE